MVYPDVVTSSEEYARRFAGPVGAWFLEVQARQTLRLLRPHRGGELLDVGGGHAQLTGPLVEAGFRVSVLGSEPGCAERLRPWLEPGRARFRAGDLLRAPFPDKSFDVVTAYRLLTHLDDWRGLVRELCRLARRAVLVDYPTRRSVNALADSLFAAKRSVEGDTRPFLVFRDAELHAAFADAGFVPRARRPQFLAPMALHRALGVAPLSRAFEEASRLLGLTAAFGSPVLALLEPRG